MNAHESVRVYGNPLPACLEHLDVPVTWVAASLEPERIAELETLMLKWLAATLQSLGLFPASSPATLKNNFPHLPDFYQAWFAESLRLLEARAWDKADWDMPSLWAEWQQATSRLQGHADYHAQLVLLTACLQALPAVLSGQRKATEVLFPNSSMALVEGIYKGNAVADMFNTILGDTVLAYCQERLAQDPTARLRLLEIGAGTGGTTAGLIAKLRPVQQHIEEYGYTDLSKAFLLHAEDHYAPSAPYLKTRLFDVGKPLAAQNIPADYYDVVIAANVLHATPSIRTALRNAKAALRNRGCLVLNELSGNSLAAHLSFGLLEGWWLYQDTALRIPGCPGLYPQTWAELLEEEGFASPRFPAQAAHQFGQQIIAAESDGMVRQVLLASINTTKDLSCHLGRDCRDPDYKDVIEDCHPWQLDSGNPCRNDGLNENYNFRDERKAFNSNVLTKVDPRQLRVQAIAYLKQLLATTLKIPAADIDSAQAMEVYGLDSILVVQLANILHKQFTGITSTLFFEVQTLDALADHLLKTQSDVFIRQLGLGGQNPATSKPIQPISPLKYGLKKSPRPISNKVSSKVSSKPENPTSPSQHAFPVAIIGLSGRYPKASDIHVFWDNLITGKNCISEIPAERWDWQAYFDAEKGKAGSHYSRWGGFIDDVDKFDPLFFHISPRDAERMDPQERLFLETAYASIEDAGYTPANLCASRKIGVFVGVMNSLYTGQASHWSIANRVSYTLNCQGPSLAVDTACSSSLTAIHLALESLYSGTSECAIAGGVNLILDPKHYTLLSEMTMISASDQCRAFGADADGFVDGEGVGAVLLKPLAQAIADHDPIYGVIKASMLNAGGKTNGYTVPNPLAQARLITEALQKAGVSPDAVSYVEAHGTGTVLGDPIEVSALSQAFAACSENALARQYCALGSVKSNIGHCESAAGIAGLTKVLLQMQHQQLASTLHATQLNPHIEFADTPFVVQQQPATWQRPVRWESGIKQELPLIAGLSSFGAGGANAHLVVEEFSGPVPSYSGRQKKPIDTAALIVLSARTPERLPIVATRLLAYVKDHADILDLADLAYTLQIGRVAMTERLAFVADSLADLQVKLDAFLNRQNQGLYLGQAKQAKETQNAVAESMAATFDGWLTTGQYPDLLNAWVQGLEIDWQKLYPHTQPHRISLPSYPFARERYWLSPAKTSAAISKPSSPLLTDLVYLPQWQEQTAMQAGQSLTAKVLIVASPAAKAFAQAIGVYHQQVHAGTVVEFVQLGASGETAASPFRPCAVDDNEGFAQCLQACPAFGRVFFVATHSHTDNGADEVQLLRLLKYLKIHTPSTATVDFFLLGQDHYRLADNRVNPDGAGLRGLAYSLAQSDHRFLVRNLDLAHEDVDQLAYWPELVRQVADEPALERGDVIKLQQGRRFRHIFKKLYWPSFAPKQAFKQRGVYVLLGGGGTVGTIISRYLLENYQAQVIWLGRTADTDANLQQKLADHNGSVRYFQADVTDLASLQQAVRRIKQDYPVIHGAIFSGVVFNFDNSLAHTTEAEFSAIFQVKQQGCVNFYEAFANESLDFMCYFSSGQAFAFSGAATLSAYASGITFADSYVQSLQNVAKFPVGTINWGFWQASLSAAALSDKVSALQDDQGFACFERFVSALAEKRLNQVLCLKASDTVRALMRGSAYPLGHKGILPANCGQDARAPKTENLTVHPSRIPQEFPSVVGKTSIIALISQSLSDALKIPASEIDLDIAFSDYGMDSVVAVGFVKQIGSGLNIPLNSAIVFDYSTINRLADYLLAQLPSISETQSLPPQASIPSIAAKTAKKTAWSEKLQSLRTAKTRAAKSHPHSAATEDKIAVIGMAGQFPDAPDVDRFWQNLINAKNGVGALPEDYQVQTPDFAPANTGYHWGGVVADRACFDPLFFNIAPREAEAMSPHQRLILQESWTALENAGYNPKSLEGQAVSVYIGAEPGIYPAVSFTGASDAIIASRLAYFLNLKGAALVVNTGCSSSAVAIHLAAESLRRGESNMALAGGVFATLDQGMLMGLAEIEMLSPSGRCHTFDASADGTAFSEGVGVVVLKRLNDALADGDPIYGVIAASGINQDGASNGMTAPNGLAQQALISEVYRRYDINPEHITYVEAHGTGTRLGDPVEANALVRAFRQFTHRRQYCAIGSTKAHIGHTSASAGVIGLIRVLLSMRHRQIPGLLHFEQLNPLIEFSGSAFYVNTETVAWEPAPGQPLMAALNSFGHSGTNAHLVVSELDTNLKGLNAATLPSNEADGVCLIVLSAKNTERLQAYAAKLLRFVQNNQSVIQLPSLAYTLQVGREAMPERLAFTAVSVAELAEKLTAYLNNRLAGLHCAHVQRQNSLLVLFANDGELAKMATVWCGLGQYDKLLGLWVQGISVDWAMLYGNTKPRRIALPTYPFARDKYWVASTDKPSATSSVDKACHPFDAAISVCQNDATSPNGTSSLVSNDNLAYLLQWQAQPRNTVKFPLKSPQTVLIVYPPSAWGFEQTLSDSFNDNHLDTQVVKIQLANQSAQTATHEWHCAVADTQSLANYLEHYPHIDSVYFLATPDSQTLNAGSITESQRYYELALLHLIQALKAQTTNHALVDCYVLTLDNYQILGSALQPLGAGVTGLAYALAQSDPRFLVRNVDLSSADLADKTSQQALVQSLWQEPASDRGEVVKLYAGGRYQQQFCLWDLPATMAVPAFKKGGTYLILGGSGSVGRVITRYLLEHYQAKVVWLGRTPTSDPALQNKLAQFAAWGQALSYHQADANHLDSLQHAIATIKQTHPVISGAIFSGLVFQHERPLADTIDAEFLGMLAIKTLGSVNFYQALQHESLDFLCYFSSIQAFPFLSAKDSAAYAAGIVFSDTFVQSLQNIANFPVGSINWGYWEDTTSGTNLANRLSKHFGLIGDVEGCQFFERFVDCLQQGLVSQALCLRAGPLVRGLMGCVEDETITICGRESVSLIQALGDEDCRQ